MPAAAGRTPDRSRVRRPMGRRCLRAVPPRRVRGAWRPRSISFHRTCQYPEVLHGNSSAGHVARGFFAPGWPRNVSVTRPRTDSVRRVTVLYDRLDRCRVSVSRLKTGGSLRPELDPSIAADLLWTMTSLRCGKTWSSNGNGRPSSIKSGTRRRGVRRSRERVARQALVTSSRGDQLADEARRLNSTNGGIVRSSQYHCDNNEVVELSVLRHKEKEIIEPTIHRSFP